MEHLLYLLSQYKYWVIFPLAIVEGPILAIIAGLLCSRGFLNPLITLSVIVAGDVIGDSLCFALGSLGVPKSIRKIIRWSGIDQGRIQKTKHFLDDHPRATIPLSKITLGVGIIGVYLIGRSGLSYRRFIRISMTTSFFQYIFYIGMGWLFGAAYKQINHYLNYVASICILLFFSILSCILIQSFIRKI
jgi:membrane-associated protein